jgi:hypothetical protein
VQDITEASVIHAASAGLLEGELTRKLTCKEAKTLQHLFRIIDGYARGEEDTKRRQEIQAEYDKAAAAAVAAVQTNTPAQVQAQAVSSAPVQVHPAPLANQVLHPRPNQAPMTWKKFRTERADKAVMAVEEVEALRKEFDSQQAGRQQQAFCKKVKKDLYCAFHRRSSHTTEQCRNIRQQGNVQAPRQQQPRVEEAPREAAPN